MALRGARAVARLGMLAERVGWAVSRSSRSFFVGLAMAVAVVVPGVSLLASRVVEWNADDVAAARAEGVQVAAAVTQFRDHLGVADAELATTLVATGAPSPLGRAQADAELRSASQLLIEAGIGATGDEAAGVSDLAQGLVRYLGLVETSRAYPVGSRFHDEARGQARCDPQAEDGCPATRQEADGRVVPLASAAEQVRTSAEAHVADATDDVTSGWRLAWLGVMALAALFLVVVNVLVAGRTRIVAHWMLVLATLSYVLLTGFVVDGAWSQRRVMDDVADEEGRAFVAANADLFLLVDLRSDELDALAFPARRSAFYERFHDTSDRLAERLGAADDGAARGRSVENLQRRFEEYVDQVGSVEADVAAGVSPDELAETTLDGEGAAAYQSVHGVAVSTVERATEDLTRRLDEADRAGVGWWSWGLAGVGIGTGLVAAAAIVHRGRQYLLRGGGR